MPRGKASSGFAGQLAKMISTLKQQRQKHADALRSIDGIFESIGITTHLAADAPAARPGRPGRKPGRPPGKRGPGRPPKAKTGAAAAPAKAKGKRGSFSTTATESILAYVKGGGPKGRASGEISKHWKNEGRSGEAFVTLGQLVKAKKLKKQKIDGERGSRYTMA